MLEAQSSSCYANECKLIAVWLAHPDEGFQVETSLEVRAEAVQFVVDDTVELRQAIKAPALFKPRAHGLLGGGQLLDIRRLNASVSMS